MSSSELAAGRLVMVDIAGKALDDGTADFLRKNKIRAVCLFRKNLGSEAQIRQLTADLRDVLGPGALIAMDQEGGSVARAVTLPQAPGAMALGAVNDLQLAEKVGAAVARGLRHLGINWNFAPVVDVNNNQANPVIGERSFGADPQHVSKMAAAWMRGAHSEHVACCIKHFPGHGDTHTDSHHALPVVDKTLSELEAMELIPFRALAQAAPSLMTAHIVYPQIDPEYPATLSPAMLTGLLRERMGYDGVVITDALMMKAVHERFGCARAAVLALRAGADMPLAQGTRDEQQATVDAIARALQDGTLDKQAMGRAQARLDALAARFPAVQKSMTDAQRADDERLMNEGWARALTAVGEPKVPARNAPLRVVTQASVASDGVSEAGLPAQAVRALFMGFSDVEFVEVKDLAHVDPELLRGNGRTVILVGNQRARYGQPSPLRPDLHLALWNPFQVLDVAAPAVVTWGYASGAMLALRAWLEGVASAQGSAPVPLAAP